MIRPTTVLIAALLLAAPMGLRAEPQYQGKPLSDWLDEMNAGRQTAVVPLSKIRPAPLHQLLSTLETNANRDAKRCASMALAQIGREARPIRMSVIDLLEDKDRRTRFWAAYALAFIDPGSKQPIRTLSASFAGDNDYWQACAAHAFRKLARTAIEAKPLLEKGLDSDSQLVRRYCAFALAEIDPKVADSVTILVNALKDDDKKIRKLACIALERIGPAAEAAISALVKALEDPVMNCRHWAAHALLSVKPRAPEALPVCVDALKDVSKQARRWAAGCLKGYGRDGQSALQALVAAYRGEDIDSVKPQIALAIKAIDPETARRLGIE